MISIGYDNTVFAKLIPEIWEKQYYHSTVKMGQIYLIEKNTNITALV